MLRIGIDVGGTNTDAVLMSDANVVDWVKAATTQDVMSGINAALSGLIAKTQVDPLTISGVMIGTTHFTNAVVQRRDLMQTAIVRLGLPATASLPPMTGAWCWSPRWAMPVQNPHRFIPRPIARSSRSRQRTPTTIYSPKTFETSEYLFRSGSL